MIPKKPIIFLIVASLTTAADLQSKLSLLNPQLPTGPVSGSQSAGNYNYLRTSDGGDFNPIFDENRWNQRMIMGQGPASSNAASSGNTFSIDSHSGYNPISTINNQTPPSYQPQSQQTTHKFVDFSSLQNQNNNLVYPTTNTTPHTTASSFNESISVINARLFFSSSQSFHQTAKLLSLTFDLLRAHHPANSLNILHLANNTTSGAGFVPLALAILCGPNDHVVSLNNDSNAKDNILKDGKEYFLRKLSLHSTSLSSSPLPRAPNNLPYNLIVLSYTIKVNAPLPKNLKDSLVPGGMIVYPEDTGNTFRFRLDKLDDFDYAFMDDLLKSVAQLDGHDLSIYSTRTVTVKPAKKPKEPQGYKRRPPKPVVLTPADLNSFDYDDFVSKFSTVCEADVAFARLDPESMSSHIKKIKRDERYEMGILDSKRINWQESFCRSERCTENRFRLKTEKTNKLLHSPGTFLSLFEANLKAQGDAVIDAKLLEMEPVITLKSFPAMYDGVRDHLENIIDMTDNLMFEMESIWSRARLQPALHDIVADFKRIRRLKNSQPSLDLAGLLDSFASKDKTEVFLDRGNVRVEVVDEAQRRLGADTYGPSKQFASLLDDLIEAEDLSVEADNSEDLSVEDIGKLQTAIKKALQAKLSQ